MKTKPRATRWPLAILVVCVIVGAFALASADAFHKGMAQLSGKGGEPTPANACARNAASNASGTVILTFDDGLRSHHDVSRSLGSQGICATFYVIASMLRQDTSYTDFISADEVRGMSAAGHDIESHTVTHQDLTTLSATAQESELRDSKAFLESLTGMPVRHIAYPYGAHDEAVDRAMVGTYTTGRVYTDTLSDLDALPGGAYGMPALGIETMTSVDQAKSYVDWARTNDRTLILAFHAIGGDGQFAWPQASFDELARYIEQSDVNVKTIAQASASGQLP